MEMHAYYDGYLSNAQDTLGNMMDYAVNSCNIYPTHHEADEERFVDTMDHIYAKKHTKSYLQQIREICQFSIDELAAETGIDPEVLVEMESDLTKINGANALVIFRLSQVLGCRMENLMEV